MLTRDQKNQNSFNLFLNNYFNIILVFILALVLTAAYIIVIQPKYSAIMLALQSNIESQQKIYIEQQKKLNNLKVINSLYDKIAADDLTKFNEVLPNNYIKERLFGEIEEVITKNGFVVNSIGLEPAKVEEVIAGEPAPVVKTGEINIALSLSAVNYSGFKKLLRLLENNLRLFDIKEINFSPGDNSLELNLVTYYYNK